MLVDNSAQIKKHEKIHKMCRSDLSAFALRNYLEGFKINKPLHGLLVYRKITPKAERKQVSSWPRSEASRETMKFSGQSFSQGIILRHTTQPSITFIISSPSPALLYKKINSNNDLRVSPTKQ